MRPADCVVVLVRPSRPGNLGAVCRAMKNTGMSRLVLVDPAPGIRSEEARSQAWQAWDILEHARQEETLRGAVAGCARVVGTSGKAEGRSPRELVQGSGREMGDVALVFGPESSGLRREEMDLCHQMVRIPSCLEQPSLNLAQAVMILAYEIFIADLPASPPDRSPASAEELESTLDALRDGLLGIGFLNRENPEPILGEIRRLLARAGPDPREVQILRGLARQIEWAASQIARPGDRKG